jgi:hypothetical protein
LTATAAGAAALALPFALIVAVEPHAGLVGAAALAVAGATWWAMQPSHATISPARNTGLQNCTSFWCIAAR